VQNFLVAVANPVAGPAVRVTSAQQEPAVVQSALVVQAILTGATTLEAILVKV
jgi:hypothetical protein